MNYSIEDGDFRSSDPLNAISFEGIDLTTAARQVSLAQPELGRLAPGDLLDNDKLSTTPFMGGTVVDATGLDDLLSGDLSSLAL